MVAKPSCRKRGFRSAAATERRIVRGQHRREIRKRQSAGGTATEGQSAGGTAAEPKGGESQSAGGSAAELGWCWFVFGKAVSRAVFEREIASDI